MWHLIDFQERLFVEQEFKTREEAEERRVELIEADPAAERLCVVSHGEPLDEPG